MRTDKANDIVRQIMSACGVFLKESLRDEFAGLIDEMVDDENDYLMQLMAAKSIQLERAVSGCEKCAARNMVVDIDDEITQ